MKVLKSVLFSVSIVLLFGSFDIPDIPGAYANSSIEWSKYEHDFGKIKQNIPVTAEFEFKNPSMIPLIIIAVKADCGCTVADYPKEPVQPGKTGKITVDFDAKIPGFFQKSVSVTSNTQEGSTTLIIKGEVAGRVLPKDTK